MSTRPKKLVHSINKAGKEGSLAEKTVDTVFEKWWPDLQQEISSILSEKDDGEKEIRSDRELLEEILELTRRTRLSTSAESQDSRIIRRSLPTALVEDFSKAISAILEEAYEKNLLDTANNLQTLVKLMIYLARGNDRATFLLEELMSEISNRKDDIIPF